ncbi:MAG: acyltransferase family protein [Actinomycetota bacterium]|nr:acyltransferase family protein [Actinomycetota bacterium]
MGFWSTAKRLAEQTPPDRNRVVDLMRVVSILVVVFGHWLMAAITIDSGELKPGHLLELADWTHPLTWIFQVMPVFFLMGGYSNALSWRSARRRGEAYGTWLRARLRRLTLPVVPLLAVWTVGGWVGLRLGFDWETLQLASRAALVPTWFLAAYVVIVTLAPAALVIWDRLGWWSIVLGTSLAGLSDLADIGGGLVPAGFLNYVFVWGTVHLLGYAWVDGKIPGTARRLGLAATGLVVLLALVWLGPYPVAMVGLDTAQITNSYPPRVTLIFLGMFQTGLVLALEPLLQRAMQRIRAWTAVVAVSALIMTLYLWHLTAMVIAIGLGLAAGGFGFGIEPLTTAWWLTRPLWFAVLAVVTGILIAIFGRFERPIRDPRPAPPWWQPVTAVLFICAGLGLLAALGIADEDGLNGLVLSLPMIGVVVGGLVRRPGAIA